LFGNVDSQAEQPVIAGGVLYVPDCGFNDSSGLDDCEIMALDAVSGARRWDQFVGSFSGNEPLPLAVDAGRLFVPYRGTSLDAVDATTGATTLWSASIPVASPAAVADGTVYVGGSDGNVYALAADTGAQRWAAHTAGSVSQPVAVANGVVYAGSDDGHLYAFDEATGTQKWSVSSGGPTQAYPSVGDGMVFVASAHGFNAFDAVTGAQRWTFAGGLFSNFFAAAVDRAKVYLTDETGPLRAFDVATGTLLWSSPVSGHPWEPADANGVLYVGTDAGGSAFNTDTGAVLWTFPVHLGGPCGLFQGGAVVHGMLYSSCGGLKL